MPLPIYKRKPLDFSRSQFKPRLANNNKDYRLVFKSTHSNLFFTFTDPGGKVISCKTPAMVGVFSKKRQKKAPQVVENIMPSLRSHAVKHKVKQWVLVMTRRRRSTKYFHYVSKESSYYGPTLKAIVFARNKPHNGVRGKKVRRK